MHLKINICYVLIYRSNNIMYIYRNVFVIQIIYITYIYFLLILFINWSFNLWKIFKYHKRTRYRAERINTYPYVKVLTFSLYIGRQKNV